MSEQSFEPVDGLNTPKLATAGFVSAVGTFIVIVLLQALYLQYESRFTAQTQDGQSSSASLLAEQRAKLNRSGWIDRENGVVAMPIDLAIQLVARELQADREVEPSAPPNSTRAAEEAVGATL